MQDCRHQQGTMQRGVGVPADRDARIHASCENTCVMQGCMRRARMHALVGMLGLQLIHDTHLPAATKGSCWHGNILPIFAAMLWSETAQPCNSQQPKPSTFAANKGFHTCSSQLLIGPGAQLRVVRLDQSAIDQSMCETQSDSANDPTGGQRADSVCKVPQRKRHICDTLSGFRGSHRARNQLHLALHPASLSSVFTDQREGAHALAIPATADDIYTQQQADDTGTTTASKHVSVRSSCIMLQI